jgi:hypothetical protein
MATTTEKVCLQCGKPQIEQNYCEYCGQKKYESRFDFSYIVGEALQTLNLEKGILFNFKVLWQNAAQNIADYMKGKTKLFYPPWQYFSVACCVFFFLLLTDIASLAGLNVNGQAEKTKAYYQEVYTSNYNNLANYLQDSMLIINNIDTLKTISKIKGRELHDNRFLENSEMERAEKQEQFVQILTYLGFYFFPFYLAIFSFLFFKKSNYLFTEHLIMHLFLVGQAIFYFSIIFAVAYCLQYLLRWFEAQTSLDTDTLVMLVQLAVFAFTCISLTKYFGHNFALIFNEKIGQSYLKTIVALALSGAVAFLLSFVAGAFVL